MRCRYAYKLIYWYVSNVTSRLSGHQTRHQPADLILRGCVGTQLLRPPTASVCWRHPRRRSPRRQLSGELMRRRITRDSTAVNFH